MSKHEMTLKRYIFSVLMMLIISAIDAQEIVVSITLSDAKIVEECHFGDDWEAYFSFGGKYRYSELSDRFILKPNEEFGLKSMIFEGKEEYNDYKDITTIIKFDQLDVGRFSFEELLYVEDKNTGRYHCNNATFKFSYIIEVSLN